MIKQLKYKDHSEWLAIRRKYIGGSDAAAVIGMSPYKSAYTLWAEKTGRIPEFEGNLATEVGSYLEDFVAKKFAEETGKKVRRKNATYVNDRYPFACANVDREIVGEDALLEIKTTTSVPIMRQLRGEEFPEAYYCQCVHYLAVTERKRIYLAVLIRNRELKIYTLERDEGEIAALMNAERKFWGFVERYEEPAADGSVSSAETLTALYPSSADVTVDLTAFESEIRDYFETKKLIEDLAERKREIENKIKEFMGDAGSGDAESFKVSYKSSERETFDSKGFRKANPAIDVSAYIKKTPTRTFKITKKGE